MSKNTPRLAVAVLTASLAVFSLIQGEEGTGPTQQTPAGPVALAALLHFSLLAPAARNCQTWLLGRALPHVRFRVAHTMHGWVAVADPIDLA